MKKLVVLCMAVMALMMASCKNEDISISREVTFNLNPYEVINGFVNTQLNDGDLDLLSSSSKLRVHLFIYDAQGNLYDDDVQYLNDYHSTMTSSFGMPDGNYVVVATTDVVEYNGTVTFEYWKFEGMDKLTELKINHAGYLGYESKILGVGHKAITVEAGQTAHSITLEPQGAVALTIVWGIHSFDDVTCYDLMTNKSFNAFAFKSDGSCEGFYEEAILNKYVHRFNPANFSSYGGYGYQFIPQGKASYRWDAATEEVTLEDIAGGVQTLTAVAGKMYQFELYLPELEATITDLSNSKSASPEKLSLGVNNNQWFGKIEK